MIGLALEGGGSRGAYHVGVMMACLDEGYDFDGFVGTSIGAVNAAAFAQGDFLKAVDLWLGINTEKLFDPDACKLLEIAETKWDEWDKDKITSTRESLRRIIEENGIDTSIIKNLIDRTIDEKKLRASGHDYGLVTVSLSERRPYEMFLEDIEQGKLTQYIAASACVPGFQTVVIDDNSFVDGALYNSCPINMLIKKGYTDIIAVRTKAPGVFRKVTAPEGVNITMVVPKHDLGNPLVFSMEKIALNIEHGYQDWKTAAGKLKPKNL